MGVIPVRTLWTYRAAVLDVHDGDTLTLLVDVGFCVTMTVKVRLLGAWAPELAEAGGVACRDYVQAMVTDTTARALAVGCDWPFWVTVSRVRSGAREVTTFGRYVATVTSSPVLGDPVSVTDAVNAYVAANGWGGGIGSGS